MALGGTPAPNLTQAEAAAAVHLAATLVQQLGADALTRRATARRYAVAEIATAPAAASTDTPPTPRRHLRGYSAAEQSIEGGLPTRRRSAALGRPSAPSRHDR